MSKSGLKKVVVVGEGRVGKTSMTLRYFKGEYRDDQESTINASYLEKTVQISDSDSINLAVWVINRLNIPTHGNLPSLDLPLLKDTAGQEKFRAIAPMYYQSAVCAIIVYDITFKESFHKVKSWVKELQEEMDMTKCVLCIAGNKCDMETSRQVDKREAEEYAASVGAKHFHTSAKLNRGIDELFLYLAQEISKKATTKKTSRMKITSKNTTTTNSAKKEKKDTCC